MVDDLELLDIPVEVPTTQRRPAPSRGRKGASMRILVATDGSRGGAAALKFAARLAARDEGSELIILTIGKPGEAAPGAAPDEPVADLGSSFEKALERRAAQKILNDAARELQRIGLEARYRFVSADRRTAVPEAISREADRLKVDLVV